MAKKNQSRNKNGRFRTTDIRTLYKRYNEGYAKKESTLSKGGMKMESGKLTYEQFKALRDARANTNRLSGSKHSVGMGMVNEIVDYNAYGMRRSQAEALKKAFEKSGAGVWSVDKIRRGAKRGDEFYSSALESIKDIYRQEYEKALLMNGGNVGAARAVARKVYSKEVFGSP